jgi:phosphoribosylanthranilate isomerase
MRGHTLTERHLSIEPRMYVKVCGITRQEDADSALVAGVDMLGFNFIPHSKRYVDVDTARTIIEHVRGQALCVAVVANLTLAQLKQLRAATGVHRFQLHGDEPEGDINALAPDAFKALRIADAEDVERAQRFPGHPLLVDAKVPGQLGGTGTCIDWPLIVPLTRRRAVIVAGGLTPDNVAHAIAQTQPWGVDTASGVELDGNPRHKDADKMLRFVRAARSAAGTLKPPLLV